jgi:Transposase DDE domain group 1
MQQPHAHRPACRSSRKAAAAEPPLVGLGRLSPSSRRAVARGGVRNGKQTGLENLPFRDFDHNAAWLEISLIAQDLIAWTQHLTLDGELAVCEPKTLRYRLLHTAARLAFHGRRAKLRLARSWPWADALAAAFARLLALPPPAR